VSCTQRRDEGFSLIEILITVALLSFIVLGLLAMFQQTQRAFRTSMTLTDVLENGRNSMDLMTRGLEEMTPSRFPDFLVGSTRYHTTNFYAQSSPLFQTPLRQGMPGTTFQGQSGTQDCRTNVVQNFFFLSQVNQDWIGVGYAVLPPFANAGVGTLYRFSATASKYFAPFLSISNQNAIQLAVQNMAQGLPVTNLSRIADGIVHLRVQAFATNGFPLLLRSFATNGVFAVATNGVLLPPNLYSNVGKVFNTGCVSAPARGVLDYYFMSNAVPASLELELGVLEPKVLERYRALPVSLPQVQRNFLSNHVAQVHLFRQRIPIRNVDFSAYQ
jgi:prepilin-type N-terminal cleavage/methylation domain-containing protein